MKNARKNNFFTFKVKIYVDFLVFMKSCQLFCHIV
uniref:Uncharacterized protein n=1 Tax=Myoviridae sp. cth2T2 TaxID=2826683 RepID=A0A8S5MB54_9CAUD|nr:MAG TPA: hypothetical protein [Myoviridae sp. cth2T2]